MAARKTAGEKHENLEKKQSNGYTLILLKESAAKKSDALSAPAWTLREKEQEPRSCACFMALVPQHGGGGASFGASSPRFPTLCCWLAACYSAPSYPSRPFFVPQRSSKWLPITVRLQRHRASPARPRTLDR